MILMSVIDILIKIKNCENSQNDVAKTQWICMFPLCRDPQTTARGGCNLRQLTYKISLKILKCAISNNVQNQKGRPSRYRQSKSKTEKGKESPPPSSNPHLQRRVQTRFLEEGEDRNFSILLSYREKSLRRPEIKVQHVNGY